MSSTKQRILASALALILALGLGACTNDDGPETTEPGAPATTDPVGS